jgi:type II secretory pathway pseudopilin PulG
MKRLDKKRLNRFGQVWIETVIYTLIAFVMIGLVLSFARPKIQELQDQAILQQSTEMMKQIDTTILTMGATGNQRIIEIGIKEGNLKIDCPNDKMIFELESQSVYSEPGKEINDGNIVILTEKKSGYNLVSLTRDYSEKYNLKLDGLEELRTVSKASTSYSLTLKNEGPGTGTDTRTILNISVT